VTKKSRSSILQRVVLAVDGSDNAGRAVHYTAALAQHFPFHIVIVSVYKHRTYQESSLSLVRTREMPAAPDEVMQNLCEEAVEWAYERLKEAGIDPDRIETLVRRGPPARTIVRTTKQQDADTVILGNRGHGDVEGFFLGSVSHKVNALSDCTCITVR